MTETTVGTDLLEALKIVTELGVNTVGEDLGVLAVDDIALPVEEPLQSRRLDSEFVSSGIGSTYGRDLVGSGVLHDGDDALKLLRGELTGTLAQVDIGLLADEVGVAATDTLDLGQGVNDLLLAVNAA